MFGIDDAIIGGLILGGASGAASGLFGMGAADQSIGAQQAMARNAHKWEVEDLRNAGLNPVLSAGGKGASAPAAAMAKTPDFDFSGALSKNSSAKLAKQQAQTAEKQGNLLDGQLVKTVAETQAQDLANASSAVDLQRKLNDFKYIDGQDPEGAAILRTWGNLAPLYSGITTANKTLGGAQARGKEALDFITKGPKDVTEERKIESMDPLQRKEYVLKKAKEQQKAAMDARANSALGLLKSNK